MNRPSLTPAVDALRTTDPRFPWIGPTDDEDDAAAAMEAVQAEHVGDADEPDRRGRWGRCRSCRASWPCATFIEGEYLAVLYLGRAADRVTARARARWAEHHDCVGCATRTHPAPTQEATP